MYFSTFCFTERVKATLVEMGNPVFSGGFSTFLAFILLAASKSYIFTTFFQVRRARAQKGFFSFTWYFNNFVCSELQMNMQMHVISV